MDIVLKADKNVCEISGWQSNTGEVNARNLTVEMCEEMCSCAMAFVTFELNNGTIYESLVIESKAEIPEIKEPQFVKIGVYSADIENGKCVKRYSPHPTNAYINNGSYSENGTEPPIPTAGTYAELLKKIDEIVISSGGITPDDVLQEINESTENEPQKVYSANVINKDIVTPIIEHITQLYGFVNEHTKSLKDISNKATSIDNESTNEQYASAKAVYDFGISVIDNHRAEVSEQIEDLRTEFNELIGGIENGSY